MSYLFSFGTVVICIAYAQKLISEKEWNNVTNDYFKGGDIITANFATVQAICTLGVIVPNIKAINEACISAIEYFTLYDKEALEKCNYNKNELLSHCVHKGKIEFRNISFTHHNDNKCVLNHMNALFHSGEKIAIVGESGCGKSTIVNLIERLYVPLSGEILIDDININKIDINYYRSLIGYVHQEPVLFDMSIKENIIFGRLSLIDEMSRLYNKIIDTLIKEACEDAYVNEFINNLPGGYEYKVGVKGSKLSGGQKQRIAIARAILCKPKIIILDEATSSLDYKSEKEVQIALDSINHKYNVTMIIIAHRLSTIKNANRIYMIKDGVICEEGTHDELLSIENGNYAKMIQSQINKRDDINDIQEQSDDINKEQLVNNNKEEEKDQKLFSKKDINYTRDQNMIKTLWLLLRDNKCNTFLAILGAFISGTMNPLLGFMLAKSINALSNQDLNKVHDDGIFYSLMYLLIAFLNASFSFLKYYKIETIGSILTYKIRKEILNKYLHLDISFYDHPSNTPGSLLTKLSIDTVQLNSIVLGLFGDTINAFGCLIVGIILSFYFSWQITLVGIVSMPLLVISELLSIKTRPYGRMSYIKANVNAGSLLSECVSNTKTVFSYNFQQTAAQLYVKYIDVVTKDFIRDSIMKGVYYGLKMLFLFCGNAVIMYTAGKLILNGSIEFEKMNLCDNIIMTTTNGMVNGILGFADFHQAKVAFKSVNSILQIKENISIT